MINYYVLDIIPIILNKFKVNNIILNGVLDEELMNQILKYCGDNNCKYNNLFSHKKSVLDILPDFNNYNAIFLNDDPNWYTVYHELHLIKNNNVEFPLVFICNNIFPYKRRDAYKNPKIIPEEFIKDNSENLVYNGILIRDDFFYASNENTSQNGVLTAIEDFLNENPLIGIMDFKLLNGITILYPKNSISHIRLSKLSEEISEFEIDYESLQDMVIEKNILSNYLSQFNSFESNDSIIDIKEEINQKNRIISEYENKIKIHDNELNYKNSQMSNLGGKLYLKDAKIKNVESKLVNAENEIINLNIKLNNANSQIESLKTNISKKEQLEYDLNNKIKDNISLLDSKCNELHQKDNQIKINQNKLKIKENQVNSIKQLYISQLSKLDSKEYCINCYKEEISNNNFEIQYLEKNIFVRKIFGKLDILYLIFKSNPKELSINLKLYKALKNSKCFDIGYYLNNNEDLRNSKLCNYFSPELHYVSNGFIEGRRFNKKYFNRNSKKELLDYIINCP